jgi:flavin-dependent dehydrogenase
VVGLIRILGGGIAGLTAAINLAKNDIETTVYEKQSDIGMKFKPNFQLLGNWDITEDIIDYLKNFNVKINFKNKIEKVIFYSPNLKYKAELNSGKRKVGYTVIRGGNKSLEYFLKKQAEKEGVKIITNFKKKIKPDINATGGKKIDLVAYGGIFRGHFDEKCATILFDYNYAPKGYVYLLPHNKKIATLAVVMRPIDNPKKFFEKLIFQHPLFNEKFNYASLKYNFSGFGDFSMPKTAIKDSCLLVGEAAGFQDYAFGFGIRYSILSGYLASKSIIQKMNYDRLWKETFLHELKKTQRIRYVLDRVDNEFLNHLILNGSKIDIEEFTKLWSSSKNSALFYLKPLLKQFIFLGK